MFLKIEDFFNGGQGKVKDTLTFESIVRYIVKLIPIFIRRFQTNQSCYSSVEKYLKTTLNLHNIILLKRQYYH